MCYVVGVSRSIFVLLKDKASSVDELDIIAVEMLAVLLVLELLVVLP